MTRAAYLTAVADILTADATEVTTTAAGSLRLTTHDDHAAHAFEIRALRAGLHVATLNHPAGQYRVLVGRFTQEG